MPVIRKILLVSIILAVFFSFAPQAKALPKGALLFRTSAHNKMYGYNTNELFKINLSGADKFEINSGHVGLYVGKVKGVESVVEALNNGIQITPAKYFVNKSAGEKLIGAKIPKNATNRQREEASLLARSLARHKMRYDFAFRTQKGPASGQWICVGLTEKLYESANVDDIKHLIYNPAHYAINITPDGFDKTSVYNQKTGDCFASKVEYSKISRRLSLGEVIGTNCGKEHNNERYFFLPYTQFLQPSLKTVKVDLAVSSNFSVNKIRGAIPVGKIILSWAKNNANSSQKIATNKTKQAIAKTTKKIKQTALKTANNIKQSWQTISQAGNFQSFFSFLAPAKQALPITHPQPAKDISQIQPDKKQERISTSSENSPIKVLAVEKAVSQTISLAAKPNKAGKLLAQQPISPQPAPANNASRQLAIKYVIDGDTFVLSTGEKVRYIGIDAPELRRPGPQDDDCLAWWAKVRNIELLGAGELKLIKDPSADKDKYGRLLRYVYAGNIFVNRRLALEGLARKFFCQPGWKNCPVPQDTARLQLIQAAVQEAQANHRGIYSAACRPAAQTKPASRHFSTLPATSTAPRQTKAKTTMTMPIFFFGGKGASSATKHNPVSASSQTHSTSSLEGNLGNSQNSQPTATTTKAIKIKVKTFSLFDWRTHSPSYTASTAVGVSIKLKPTPDAYWLATAASSAPATTSPNWQLGQPQKYILSGADGQKEVNLWLKYGPDIVWAASTSIILDRQPPQLNIIANQPQLSATSAVSFDLAVNEPVLEWQYKFNNQNDWLAVATNTKIQANFNDGWHQLNVQAIDLAGNFASSTLNFSVDTTAPSSTLNALPAVIATGTASTAASFLISWRGQDNLRLKNYDLQYKLSLNNSWLDLALATTATSAAFRLEAATTTTIYFRLRARDQAGNVEAWAPSQSGDVKTTIIIKPQKLTDGLQYLWPCDEAVNNNTFDSLKSAVINDIILAVPGRFGNYASLFGSRNSYLPKPLTGQGLTIAFYWLPAPAEGKNIYVYFSNRQNANIVGLKINASASTSRAIINYYQNSYEADCGHLDSNAWHQIVFIVHKNYLALYIDGARVFSQPGEFIIKDILSNLHFAISDFFIIALAQAPDLAQFAFDELAIWNRALRAEEVQKLNGLPIHWQ